MERGREGGGGRETERQRGRRETERQDTYRVQYNNACISPSLSLFQICDADNDNLLSDQELNDFQVSL